MAKSKRAKGKTEKVELKGFPHNGEGRPDLAFPDPVTGEKIGGQKAANRMAMRYRHVVTPWARRQGKTRSRQFLLPQEATVTPGMYYAGIVYPDHTTAAKIASNFREAWGDMVIDSKINDKDQDRWIKLPPMVPPRKEPPDWFTDYQRARWKKCYETKTRNTGTLAYFWGGSHPHYEKIQGFPHHFNRVDWDEVQLIHPSAHGVVRPMIRDVRGFEWFSGTPWYTGIGNTKFESYWDVAGESTSAHWFRMRIPDGTNPHVPPEDVQEALKTSSLEEIQQTMFARFLSGAGAIFSNLDAVFVLESLHPNSASCEWIRDLRAKWSMPTVQWWVHQPKPIAGHTYGASVDWARSPKGDFSVMTVFDFSTGKQAALLRWRGENFTKQMEMVLAVIAHYRADQIHTDNNGMGEAMADFMRRRHNRGFIGHKFGRNKGDYVRKGQVLFQDSDVQMIDCAVQKKEFKDFSAHESQGISSEKKITYAALAGGHDDTVAAFLQLAPTLTIVGRQWEPEPETVEPPVFDEHGKTTLENLWPEYEAPFNEPTEELTWDDIVIV